MKAYQDKPAALHNRLNASRNELVKLVEIKTFSIAHQNRIENVIEQFIW